MKITKIEAIPVSIPVAKTFAVSLGAIEALDHVITKVHTDEGVTGIGEAAPVPFYSEECQEDIKVAIDRYLAKAVAGEEAFNLEKVMERMNTILVGHMYAKAAVELALWDIMGKALSVPVYKLMGGRYRETVPVVWVLGFAQAGDLASEAAERVKQGFTSLKLKVGLGPERDLQNIAAIREAVGSSPTIRVDANQGYTADAAIRVFRKMEGYGLELIEQPVPRWDFHGMAKVSRALDTPVMADETVFTPEDAIRVVEAEAADIINIKIMKPGGLLGSKKIASIAEAAGIPCLVGSMIEMGVGTAAAAHFAASTRAVRYPCELIGNALAVDDVLSERYVAEGGILRVPEKPGLGVELDEEKVEKYRRES